jgi:hypothetical protein
MQTSWLKDIARRPRSYWNIDGLPELGVGVLWLVWGGYFLSREAVPRGGVYQVYRNMGLLLVVGFCLGMNWALKRLKERITFPRTGYMTLRPPSRAQRLVTMLLGAAVAVGMVVLVRRGGVFWETWAGPLMGLLLAFALLAVGICQRLRSMLVLALLAVPCGFLGRALAPGWGGMNWLFVLLGAAATVAGAVRLRGFLRRNPLPREAE